MVVSGGSRTAVRLSAHMTTKIERPRIDVRRQLVTITPVNRGDNTCTCPGARREGG